MLRKWFFTVLSATQRESAISLLVSPFTINSSTSISRGVNLPAGPKGAARASARELNSLRILAAIRGERGAGHNHRYER